MCCASNTRWEHLCGDQERRAIRTNSQQKLREGKYNHQTTCRGVCALCANSGPYSIKDAHHDRGPELLAYTADATRKEDADVESREIPCCLYDYITHSGVVQCLPWCCSMGITDSCQYNTLVEIDTIISDIAMCISLGGGGYFLF